MISITKEFKFEMAHALLNYDGLCKNIHGHSYRLWVTIRGNIVNDSSNPKNGMVLDFSDIKSIVNREIIDKYDHSLVLNSDAHGADFPFSSYEKVYMLPFQPTSENLVIEFAQRISQNLPNNRVFLSKVVLSETATSFVEWNEHFSKGV